MKRLLKTVSAVFLAVLMGIVPSVRALAADPETPDYISEIKIFYGDASLASAEGYTLLKDGDTPVDLNQKAGGGLGSKGEKAVYLGYKTTKKADEAITDLALMNMKGGYSVKDYDYLMETHMKSQIVPLVDGFLATIKEYRTNYEAGDQKAVYINRMLNKFIDDDTGKGLGDLLLNETVYEMAKPKFDAMTAAQKEKTSLYKVNLQVRDALPNDERNNHADILTILAQSNGKATLMMENLLTRAADPNDTTWLERFSKITYDVLVDSTGLSPTDADKQLAKLYDDAAALILDMWDDLCQSLLGYDSAAKRVNAYDVSKYEAALAAVKALTDDTDAEEAVRVYREFEDAEIEFLSIKADLKTIAIHDALAKIDYEEDTMLDFFTTDADELADDVTLLYPLAASLTPGQKAGIEFISLQEMLVIALTDESGYDDAALDALNEISIYDGVDRGIYESCAVGLTSDALRAKAFLQNEEESSMFSGWSITMMALTGASFLAFAGSAVAWGVYASKVSALTKEVNSELLLYEMTMPKPKGFSWSLTHVYQNNPEWRTQMESLTSKSTMCKGLTFGFGVAMVILAGVTTVLTWREMQAYYDVDFTAIPRYMVDEKDIIAYNKKGEKVIIKNQSAYYKAVECKRTGNDEMFGVLGTYADMNGDVGKQWLALYAVKNELMEPIIASSLKAVVGSAGLPAGYETGIHMFGSDAAFNMNSSLYDWNNDAPATYVYFQTDSGVSAGAAGSNFSGGLLALVGGAGLLVGAAATILVVRFRKKSGKLTAKAG